MARYQRLVGSNAQQNDIVEIRGIKIDKTARRVWVNGEEKAFTTKEFDLLTFLLKIRIMFSQKMSCFVKSGIWHQSVILQL